MRVRGELLAAVVCATVAPASLSGVAGAQQQLSVASGGEPAPHVCLRGHPCTSIYAPLVLALDDRVEVTAPFGTQAVTISVPHAPIPGAAACRRGRSRSLTVPEAPPRFLCPVPPGATGEPRLSVTARFGPASEQVWDFDTLVVGHRGRRATDPGAKVRFRLAGRHLRLQLPLAETPASDARGQLWGERLTAACVNRAWSPKRPYRGLRFARLRWPARQGGVSVRFERPLSGSPRWCLVERNGSDVALARFPRR